MTAETLFKPTEEEIRDVIAEQALDGKVLVKKVRQDDILVLYFEELS